MYFFHVSKEMLMQTMVLFVFGSPASFRHAGEPLASCPRLHGKAKAKNTIAFISISFVQGMEKYKTKVFIRISLYHNCRRAKTLYFYSFFFHVSKEMLINTLVFFVFGSLVSLWHSGKTLASCPRLHGNAKHKKPLFV